MRRESGIGEGVPADGAAVASPPCVMLPPDDGTDSRVEIKGGSEERRDWIFRARGSGSGSAF